MKRPFLTAPALAAIAIAAGCGGSSGDPDADPAALVPANAPVYLEAALGGDDADAVRALTRKLAGTDDPDAELKRIVERALGDGGKDKVSWDEDFAPWLGDRVGVFLTSVAEDEAEGALVAATEDADKAKETLEKELAEHDEGEQAPEVASRTYKDVSYKVDTRGGTAIAIVDDYALAGTEAGVKAAIDASEGDGLADADAFKKAREEVEDSVGFGYVRLESLLSAAGPQVAALRPLLGELGEAMTFALDAEDDAIRVEAAMLGVRGAAAKADPGSVLGSLPGDAWAAMGVGDFGKQLEQGLRQASQLSAIGGGVSLDQALAQLEQATGIDLKRDLLSWMGDAGLFIRGKSIADIGGAVVVASSNPAATARVVPRLGRFIRMVGDGISVRELKADGVDAGVTLRTAEFPLPIHLAAAGDRFVVAVTDGALQAAVAPDGTLESAPAFKNAAGKLGDGIKPAFFLDFAPVRGLIYATGATQGEGEEAEQARKALDRLTTIAAGAEQDGDVQRARFVVGVK